MIALLGTFYKTFNKARDCADRKEKMWKGKHEWFVIKIAKGYLVLNEAQTEAYLEEIEA